MRKKLEPYQLRLSHVAMIVALSLIVTWLGGCASLRPVHSDQPREVYCDEEGLPMNLADLGGQDGWEDLEIMKRWNR